jgi:hypothetical protein
MSRVMEERGIKQVQHFMEDHPSAKRQHGKRQSRRWIKESRAEINDVVLSRPICLRIDACARARAEATKVHDP